jgi:hypothetical protein
MRKQRSLREIKMESLGQSRNQNSLKIWKRVVRSGEEETRPISSTNALLGKRKGGTEISNSDE